MRNNHNQAGIAAVESVLLVLIVAIIGFTGYKVYQSRQSVNSLNQSAVDTSNSQKPITSSSKEVPAVKKTGDLDKTQAALDKENPDDNTSDVNQLDSQTASF